MLSDSTIDAAERDHIIRRTKLARKKEELLTSLRMNKNQQQQLREEREALLIALDDIGSQIDEEKRAWAEHVRKFGAVEAGEVAL